MKNLYISIILSLFFCTLIIHAQCDPEFNISVSNSGFESGIAPWAPIKTNTLEASTAQSHSGQQSLFVSNRTATWHGPDLNLLNTFTVGKKYCISAWVKWEGDVSNKLELVIRRKNASGTVTYNRAC
ncbi:hypothetical protein MNBD_BACTEROID03-180 [hydrothermal vent metagenome]|uniref:CBM-cenC domain-containing protein n=1 Tax=hydrothermal vent metagenome TaxID=652676 RepID=A0A3B0U005_9ZZZZ